ncbi:hypothetical protein FHU30_007436 [Actinomadura rupiterrae]|nr:hypothetical protein [Actinomadura rupiterrae]
MTGQDVAAQLKDRTGRRWSDSKISRIETGRVSATVGDVRDMLDLYEVTDPDTRNALFGLAREAVQQGWWQPYNDLLSRNYATFIDLEAAAAWMRIFEPLVVPGLLQTPAYAREIIRKGGPLELDENELERRVELRMRRQTVAQESGLSLWVVLDEAVLHKQVGDKQVMRAQLERLVTEARTSRLALHVIPSESGGHAATSGAFGIFVFPDDDDRDSVYVDTMAGTLYLDRPSDVAAANLVFDHLLVAALNSDDSLALIAAVAEKYR